MTIDTSYMNGWKCLRAYYLTVGRLAYPSGVTPPPIPEDAPVADHEISRKKTRGLRMSQRNE